MAKTSSSSIPSPPYAPTTGKAARYASFGMLSAIVTLFVLPEIFGSAAIILGAYSWKNDTTTSNRGLFVIILGIACMLLGIYALSYIRLVDLILA
jgi:membrane-bound ClpP family serine protease